MENQHDEHVTKSQASAFQQENSAQVFATEFRSPPPLQFEKEESELESSMEQDLVLDVPTDPNDEPGAGSQQEGGGLIGQMEESFGQSFSDVSFIENSQLAVDMQSRAFAQDSEIHFAPGEYNESSTEGKALIGHELAHVVQQRQGRVQATAQMKGFSLNNDSNLEVEADQAGAKAAIGQRVNLPAFSLHSSSTSVLQGNDGLLSLLGLETGEEFAARRERDRPGEQDQQEVELEERRRHPEQWSVAFDVQGGEQVIKEYDSSHEQRNPSTYVDSRPHYRVGDIILTSEIHEDTLRTMFPGLQQLIGEDQETTAWDALSSYMDSHSGERKIGWRITQIQNTEPDTGSGNVNLSAVLLISEQEAVEIEGHNSSRTYGREALSGQFDRLRAHAALTTLIEVIATATQFSMTLLNGSAGMAAVGRNLGAAGLRMLPNVLRGPAVRIVTFLGSSLLSSCASAAMTVISDIQEQEDANAVREGAGLETQEMHYEDIITQALVSVFTGLIADRFSNFLNERISSGLSELLPTYLQQTLGTRFRIFIAQQIVGGLGRALHLGTALATARRRAGRGESFHTALGEELASSIAPTVNNPRAAAESILGSFVSQVNE